jgi:hypothetical protein
VLPIGNGKLRKQATRSHAKHNTLAAERQVPDFLIGPRNKKTTKKKVGR